MDLLEIEIEPYRNHGTGWLISDRIEDSLVQILERTVLKSYEDSIPESLTNECVPLFFNGAFLLHELNMECRPQSGLLTSSNVLVEVIQPPAILTETDLSGEGRSAEQIMLDGT